MNVRHEEADAHPSDLTPVASNPVFCPNKNVHHRTDAMKELHGSRERPIEVPQAPNGRYVEWEYAEILRRMPVPYTKCVQELLRDETAGKDLDRIVVRDVGSNHHVFWFDVTERLKEKSREMARAFEDYRAGKPVSREYRAAIEGAMKLRKEAEDRAQGGA